MKPKIYGIGKCGSRVAFDFSAYTWSHPTAFELRMKPQLVAIQERTFSNLVSRLKDLSERLVSFVRDTPQTPVRLYTDYSSVAVDSDRERNEVLEIQTRLVAQRYRRLPIDDTMELPGREGGCQFGIVSEAFARRWTNGHQRPASLALNAQTDGFALIAASLGGGTGSGASLEIARIVWDMYPKMQARPVHITVVGVLPISGVGYDDGVSPVWESDEATNTGRALCRFWSEAEPTKARRIGMWLVSNDLLRQGGAASEQATASEAISAINWHIAAISCFLANVASAPEQQESANRIRFAMATATFDASEMNNVLGRSVYLSGYASQEVSSEPFDASQNSRLSRARKLVLAAIRSLDISRSTEAPLGCAVRFRESEWDAQALNEWVNSGAPGSPVRIPVECRTAKTVAILYGQPETESGGWRESYVRQAVAELFPAADIKSYPFLHAYGPHEYLCLFVVEPFLRVCYEAVVRYAARHFGGDEQLLGQMDDAFVAGDMSVVRELIAALPSDTETYDKSSASEVVAMLDSSKESASAIGRAELEIALGRLMGAYHRKPLARAGTRL